MAGFPDPRKIKTLPDTILELKPNAYLLFSQQTSELVQDPFSLNWYQKTENGAPKRIDVAVIEMNFRTKDRKSQGFTENLTPIKGYVLSPPEALETFDFTEQLEMVLTHSVLGSEVRGLIDILMTAHSHIKEIYEEVGGVPFTGFFSTVGSGETPE